MQLRKNRGFVILVTLLLIVALFTAGCSNQAAPAKEKVLVIGYDRDAELLDTIKTAWLSDALIYIHDRLVTRDYDFNYQPGLAESWKTSDDGLVWTFHLKEGVKFHDGTPLTAKDVEFTLKTIIDPATASPAASSLAAIEDVVAKDELTIDIILKHPFPNLLFILSNTSCGIVSEKAYQQEGYGTEFVIGTGPYKFKEWIKGDKIILEKNPDYDWGPDWMENNGKPIIDRIEMRVIPEESARQMELETGNVHVLRNVPAAFVEQLEGNEDIQIVRGDATKVAYLAYPCDKEPFTDVRVRRAINHAINKEEIVTYLLRGVGQPAYGYLPPALKSEYYADSEKESYEYNVEKAKALLAEAGYEDGLKLTLSAENSSEFSKLAEVLQSQLKEVGIETEIQLYDSSSYTEMLKEGKQELFIRLYSWPNADILDYFLLSSQFPYPNHSRWLDEKTDELIQAAARSTTWEERAKGYHEVQKHLIEQAVWAPIYIPDSVLAVRKEVKNFKFHPWIPQYNDGFDMEIE